MEVPLYELNWSCWVRMLAKRIFYVSAEIEKSAICGLGYWMKHSAYWYSMWLPKRAPVSPQSSRNAISHSRCCHAHKSSDSTTQLTTRSRRRAVCYDQIGSFCCLDSTNQVNVLYRLLPPNQFDRLLYLLTYL